jgi:hypothetical protein
MTGRLFWFVWLIAFASVGAVVAAQATLGRHRSYTDPQTGFQIDMPSELRRAVGTRGDGIVRFERPQGDWSVEVSFEGSASDYALSAWMSLEAEIFRAAGWTLIEQRESSGGWVSFIVRRSGNAVIKYAAACAPERGFLAIRIDYDDRDEKVKALSRKLLGSVEFTWDSACQPMAGRW